MTTKPPQRRFSDLDVIRRAAVILTGDPDPVRAAVSEWLRDVAAHYDELSLTEIRYAADVSRAALIEIVTTARQGLSTVSTDLSSGPYTVDAGAGKTQ